MDSIEAGTGPRSPQRGRRGGKGGSKSPAIAVSSEQPAWTETYRRIMEQAGPPVIIIDGQGRMVHLSSAAARFLALSTEELSSDLLEAVHPALREAFRRALDEHARGTALPERGLAPVFSLDGELQTVRVRVSPLGDTLPGHRLVSIEAHPPETSLRKTIAALPGTSRVRTGTGWLRWQLADLSAQDAAAVARDRADTERLRAINEKLRRTSEELEVSREELQSLAEELTSANRMLEEKLTELAHANSDLRNFMAATAIATVFLDRELRITRYTQAATALFRITQTDVGRPLANLRCDLDYSGLEADAASVLAHLRPVEREVEGTGGECFLVRLLPYRTVNDRIAGVVLTCVNITERKQAETHRQAKEAAEGINRARNEFLSRMSHELRTPLNAILGFGQILELSSQNEEDRTALGLILKAGRHLLSLVDEVLDLTRAEGGELRLTIHPVDLGTLARDCVRFIARLAETHGVACEVEEPDTPLAPLRTDPQRLRQVLLNLLTNAVKYNRPGGRVTLSLGYERNGHYVLGVRDTGVGISAEDLPRLFTPFERLHHERGEIEGTGLGLAITRRLVEALGGTIEVESTPQRGSYFRVRLPEAGMTEASVPAVPAG